MKNPSPLDLLLQSTRWHPSVDYLKEKKFPPRKNGNTFAVNYKGDSFVLTYSEDRWYVKSLNDSDMYDILFQQKLAIGIVETTEGLRKLLKDHRNLESEICQWVNKESPC